MPKIFSVVYMPSSYTLLALELILKIRKPTKTYNYHQPKRVNKQKIRWLDYISVKNLTKHYYPIRYG